MCSVREKEKKNGKQTWYYNGKFCILGLILERFLYNNLPPILDLSVNQQTIVQTVQDKFSVRGLRAGWFASMCINKKFWPPGAHFECAHLEQKYMPTRALCMPKITDSLLLWHHRKQQT